MAQTRTQGPVVREQTPAPAKPPGEPKKLKFPTAFAPSNGLYGIENSRGLVSADEQGFLYGSAMIFLFVLAVGAFITVTMKTGAIQTGIGRLALRFRASGSRSW